ncbi:hypothetical protein AVEN_83551-1 [Araneus ventricosus]|uniref:Uncharacterized protein n=1 Tax=Araneus ventricosus TaxID=182803 RepID=A0A4Y2IFM7_ARAVE|nr:hypothetical protein AVEN_34764-1 [Araneus ventricosus]GBM76541.1 hypothetical protein AVEN_83551-1 [Araneus ventricosus]
MTPLLRSIRQSLGETTPVGLLGKIELVRSWKDEDKIFQELLPGILQSVMHWFQTGGNIRRFSTKRTRAVTLHGDQTTRLFRKCHIRDRAVGEVNKRNRYCDIAKFKTRINAKDCHRLVALTQTKYVDDSTLERIEFVKFCPDADRSFPGTGNSTEYQMQVMASVPS